MKTPQKEIDTAVAQFAFLIKEHASFEEAWELVKQRPALDPADLDDLHHLCIAAGDKEVEARMAGHPSDAPL